MTRRSRAPIALSFYALVLGSALAAGSFGNGSTRPEQARPVVAPVYSVDATVGSKTIVVREDGEPVQP